MEEGEIFGGRYLEGGFISEGRVDIWNEGGYLEGG